MYKDVTRNIWTILPPRNTFGKNKVRKEIDMTLGEKIKKLRVAKGMSQEKLAEELNVSRSAIATSDSNNYLGQHVDIELGGWNDGVSDVIIVNEDEDFLFYQKWIKMTWICGMIGKKNITSVTVLRKANTAQERAGIIDENYFCSKHVMTELAAREGPIKGFFDFRDDDLRDVVITRFEGSTIKLQFGKEIDLDEITKIEELNDLHQDSV